jgi:DNA-binding LacI/PurR family transcriptional regulator/DNA-binding transcriptional regulator YhcF (GntR family)
MDSEAHKAYNYLKANLAGSVWQQGDTLPGIRRLAATAGVSRAFMVEAVGRLRKEGLVTVYARKRLKAGSPGLEPKQPDDAREPWEWKRKLLERDIVSGAFGLRGTLPRQKELQARYGVCFRTMKKILQSMEADEVVASKGKGYALPGTSSLSARQRVVFITCTGHFLLVSALNKEKNRVANLFENECRLMGIHMDIVEIDYFDSGATRRAVSHLADSDSILGYILDHWGGSEVFQRANMDVLTRLVQFGKPVAILDETGSFDLPPKFRSNHLAQVYKIEGKRAGERIARFLLGLGHRKAIYISSHHFAMWSRDRYDGIAAQYSRAGIAGGVELVSAGSRDELGRAFSLSGLDDSELKRWIAIGRTPSQARDLWNYWVVRREQEPVEIHAGKKAEAGLRKNLACMGSMLRLGLDDDFLEIVGNGANRAIEMKILSITLRPLFEQALQNREATVWICANDAIAMRAVEFLREHRIRVPHDLSVTGFDNEPENALKQGLTTLDFNALGFVRRMLYFIMRPPRPRGPCRHTPIEVEGMIMQRDTTAPAKAKSKGPNQAKTPAMAKMSCLTKSNLTEF